jgi:hypothetical protein
MISVEELKKLAAETGCLIHKSKDTFDYSLYYPNEIFNCSSITLSDHIANSTIISANFIEYSVWCYTKLRYDRLPWEDENYYNLVNGDNEDGEGKFYKDYTYEQLKEIVINTIKLIKETQQNHKIQNIEKDFK